jgi:hypothetical protein
VAALEGSQRNPVSGVSWLASPLWRLPRQAGVGGLLYGGLLYGAPLALIHLLYNRVSSPWDGAVILIYFFLLYGLWAGVTFLGTTALAWGAARLLSRTTPPAPAVTLARGVSLGIFVFNLVFWVLYCLYGLTYDQLPGFLKPATSVTPMVGYLLVLLVLLTVVTGGVSWLLGRLLMSLHASRRVRYLAVVLGGLALLLHLGIPRGLRTQQHSATAATEAPETSAAPPVSPPAQAEARDFPTLFVGLDGADWQVMEPLLKAGELPTFQRLIDTGFAAPLATLPDSNSAVIWASIYTGQTPQDHQIHDFYRIELLGMGGPGLFPVHRTYFKELAGYLEAVGLARRTMVSRFDLQALPFWEVAHYQEKSIGVVDGYFYSFPVFPALGEDSFMLAYGLDGFEQRLQGGQGRSNDLPLFLHPPQLYRDLRPFLERGDFHWQSASLLHLLEQGHPQPDLLAFYTHEPDTAQHHHWKWYQPELFLGVSAADIAAKGERIPDLYRAFDAFLGELLPRLDPDTAVVIASDHGHAATILHGRFFTQHRHGPPGIVIASGGPFRASRGTRPGVLGGPGGDRKAPHVYDLYPTLLYLLGLPVPEALPGRVWSEAFEEDFLQLHPIQSTASYNGLYGNPWSGSGPQDQERNQQEIDKLKSLGYL